jgi:hypothetical protein
MVGGDPAGNGGWRWRCACGKTLSRYKAMTPAQRARLRRARRRRYQRQKELLRAIVREAKAGPCADCGLSWPYYVMHFDHVRGDKLFNIGKISSIAHGVSERRLRAEIAKCDLVCSNCHLIRHAGDCTTDEQKAKLAEHNRRQRLAADGSLL